MTNNSGKFVSTISNKEIEATAEMTVPDMARSIPPVPKATFLQTVEDCFGRFWWIWIIILLIIKNR